MLVPLNGLSCHVGEHVDEEWIVVDGRGASHGDTQFRAHFRCFVVEVVEYFDVVCNKTDGTKDNRI